MENMDFVERMQTIAKKISTLKDSIQTEEATKNAFIMPFLGNILGYDVFDPTEVVPEYTADIASKKGEKVDYAIMKDGEVQILVECKKCSEPLLEIHQAQLGRYFHVTNSRIGILTNGILYQFFTDLDKPNVMDSRPFLEINMLDINEAMVPELKKMTKSAFNIDAIISTAGELKYLNQIKKIITSLFASPTEEFVKSIAAQVYEGIKTAKVLDQFMELTKRAMNEFMKEQLTVRFENAIGTTLPQPKPTSSAPADPLIEESSPDDKKDSGIMTTDEELEGFHIVKAIIRKEMPVHRIFHRDTKSYFGILIDDNNRKPVCRLHFNTAQKYIELFDAEKVGTRVAIATIDEIYNHSEQLLNTVLMYRE